MALAEEAASKASHFASVRQSDFQRRPEHTDEIAYEIDEGHACCCFFVGLAIPSVLGDCAYADIFACEDSVVIIGPSLKRLPALPRTS